MNLLILMTRQLQVSQGMGKGGGGPRLLPEDRALPRGPLAQNAVKVLRIDVLGRNENPTGEEDLCLKRRSEHVSDAIRKWPRERYEWLRSCRRMVEVTLSILSCWNVTDSSAAVDGRVLLVTGWSSS